MIDCFQHLSLQMFFFGFFHSIIHCFCSTTALVLYIFSSSTAFSLKISLFSQKALSFFHQLCSCESFHTIIRPTIPLLLFIRLLWPCTSSACHSSVYTITAAHTISPSLLPQKYGHMVPLTGFWSKWLYLVTILLSFSISGESQTGLENCE